MAEKPPAVNLRILSPSTELQGGLSFPDLPATTTIQELRTRIQDTAPSKPAPDRMRLIYRGRVIANEADTLATVFGAENVRHCVGDDVSSMADGGRSAKPRTRASTSSSASYLPTRLLLQRLLHGLRPFHQTPSAQCRPPHQPIRCKRIPSGRRHSRRPRRLTITTTATILMRPVPSKFLSPSRCPCPRLSSNTSSAWPRTPRIRARRIGRLREEQRRKQLVRKSRQWASHHRQAGALPMFPPAAEQCGRTAWDPTESGGASHTAT